MQMRLIVAIIQRVDSGKLTNALISHGFRATRIPTVGGFLDEPNVTILIGTEPERVGQVLTLIHENCRSRRRYMNAAPLTIETAGLPVSSAAPIEVEIGGATVFTLPVRYFGRLGGAQMPQPSGLEGQHPVLMLAVAQAADADLIIGSLTKAKLRLTRINTEGGFLKKGNATLLVGLEARHVDRALDTIHRACRQRSEANAMKEGMPMYGATVFVLDVNPLANLA